MSSSPRAILSRYLSAAALVRLADEGMRVALVLLALERTGSVRLGGALVAGFLGPHILAAPAVGALVDHVLRRKVLQVLGILVFAAAIVGCGLSVGHIPGWASVLIAVAGGSCGPLLTGGMSSLPVIMLPPSSLARAYAADGATYNVGGVLGPALAAVIAAALGAGAATFVLAGVVVAGAVMVATLPIPDGRANVEGPTLRNFARGLASMWHARTLRIVTIASTLSQIGIGGLPIIAALIASRSGHAANAGLLLSTFAAAGVCSALLNTWRPFAPDSPEIVAAVSLLATGIPLALVSLVHGVGVSAVLFGIAGLGGGPFIGSLLSVRQRHAHDAHRTQVFMVAAGLRSAFAAVGAGVAGATAGIGVTRMILFAASIQVVLGAGALWLLRARPMSVTVSAAD